MRGKSFWLNTKQSALLEYIVSMYKELHMDSWKEGINPEEERLVNQILKKLDVSGGNSE